MPSYKSSRVLLRNAPKELVEHYEQSHEVAGFFMRLLVAMRQEPYCVRSEDGNVREVDQDENDLLLRQFATELSDGVRADLRAFAKAVLHQDDKKKRAFLESDNCVSLLCVKESRSGTVYHKRAEYRLMKRAVDEGWDWPTMQAALSGQDGAEVVEKYATFRLEEWQRFLASGNLVEFGRELLRRDTKEGIQAALRLRDRGVFPVPLPVELDLDSLKAAMASAAERLKSWLSCSQRAADEKQRLREHFERRLADVQSDKYALFKEFAAELQADDYDLTKKLVVTVGKHFPAREPGQFKRAVEVLKQDQYRPLWDDFTELGLAFLAERRWEQRAGRAALTFCHPDRSPIKVRFGLTGRGRKFVLSTDRRSFLINLKLPCGDVGLTAVPSRYFWDPRVERSDENSFRVEFTKRTTENRRLVGEVKEISFLRNAQRYYCFIDYNFEPTPAPEESKKGHAYFRAPLRDSSPKPKANLTIMGLDLGINPAFAFAVCTLGRHDRGIASPVAKMKPVTFHATGVYGKIANRALHSEIRALSDRCYYGPKYIRLSKKLRDRGRLNEVEEKLLEETFVPGFGITHVVDPEDRRRRIAQCVKEIKLEFKRLRHQFYMRYHGDRRKQPELVSPECFQMLFLLKNLRSLLKSWNRYHWTTDDREQRGGSPDELRSYTRHYNNLRLDTLKKLTCAVVRTAKQHGVDLIAIEDIKRGDRDDEVKRRKENSLLSLWAPGMVLERIEQELRNEGMLTWRVDPRHTSQTSCVTEEFGYRPVVGKENFYFEQDRQLYRINSDINAAINIARRFLTRYRSLSQLWAYPLDDGTYLVNAERDHERAYLEIESGSPHARLRPTGRNFALEGVSDEERGQLQERIAKRRTCRFYRHGDTWFPPEEHRLEVQKLRDQVIAVGNAGIPEYPT